MNPLPRETEAFLASATPAGFAQTASRGAWKMARHLALFNRVALDMAARRRKRVIITCPPRHGKLVADDEPVMTAGGWKRHGELTVGDSVFSPDGKQIAVLHVFEPDEATLKVCFGDGSSVRVHPHHEWVVYDRSKRSWRTMETRDIMARGVTVYRRLNFQVGNSEPLEFAERHLPVAPYTLGAWLGNGSEGKPCITQGAADTIVADSVAADGYEVSATCVHADTGCPTFYFSGGLKTALREAGVFNNKHIPAVYMAASVRQREELLAGLIDTDGHVNADGHVVFSNTNEGVVSGFTELTRSLGFRCCVTKTPPVTSSSGVVGRKWVYQVKFAPWRALPTRVPRKAVEGRCLRRLRSITSIEPCKPVPGRCIQVEGGLYLVGEHLIPTHNSRFWSQYVPSWWVGTFPDQRVIIASYGAELATSWSARARVDFEAWGPRLFGQRVAGRSTAGDRWNLVGRDGGVQACGAGGPIVGHGCDLLVIDDPFKNAAEAKSQARRNGVWEWFLSTALTRLEPDACVVIIVTRWDDDDLVGRIIRQQNEQALGLFDDDGEAVRMPSSETWEVVNLPALATCREPPWPAGLERIRGDSLWPERYDRQALLRIRSKIGERWFASLYQGSPTPEGGDLFRAEWFNHHLAAPPLRRSVRFYDLAATESTGDNDPDWTVGALVGLDRSENLVVRDVVRFRKNPAGVVAGIAATAKTDGREVPIVVEKEGGASGKIAIDLLIRELMRKGLRRHRVSGQSTGRASKVERANPVSSLAENGMFYLVRASWNEALVQEFCSFPGGKNDDIVDAVSGAYAWLATHRGTGGYSAGHPAHAEIYGYKADR
jgi:predicted phage terminase large subunit-like protein